MSELRLTTGVCRRICNPDVENAELMSLCPVLQILEIRIAPMKPGTKASPKKILQIRMSDSQDWFSGALHENLNNLVEDGTLGKYVVVRIVGWTRVVERGLFVVRNVERLASPGVRIGCPTAISFPRAGAASAQPSSPGPSSLGTSASMNSGFKQESPSSSPFSSSQSEQLSQGTDTNFCPISRLNPYINYWKIKARVTQKSPLQSWSNDRGSGVRFQITFMDKTGKIQATSFEERLYGVLQKHSVYTVSNAAVNPIRKEFTKLDHDCEIILKGGALIEESESDGDVPNSWETFIPLRDLQSQEKGSLCDVMAIVHDIGPLQPKNIQGRSTFVRTLTLIDKTEFPVTASIWGNQASQFQSDGHPLVVIEQVKITPYRGISLSVSSISTMTIDPTFSAAVQLRKWYDTEPHPDSFGSRCNENVSARHLNDSLPNDIIFIADVYESDMGSQTPQTFTIRAMVRLIYSEKIDDIVYPACRNCSRRVTLVDGIWQCGKCKEDFARLEYRYKLNMKVKDLSGEMTLSGFNNIGLSLFDGMPAEQLVNIQREDHKAFTDTVDQVISRTFYFTCQAKRHYYNERSTVKYDVQSIHAVDYLEEAQRQMALLDSSWGQSAK